MLPGGFRQRTYLQDEDHSRQDSEKSSNRCVSQTTFGDEAFQYSLQNFARGIDDFLNIMLIDTVELIQRLKPTVAAVRGPRYWLAILCLVLTLSGLIGHGSPSVNDRLQSEGIYIKA